MLRDIRGVDDVEEEFGDIRAACTKAALITNPWRTICRPAYAPQLFIAITATLFQQWTGGDLLLVMMSHHQGLQSHATQYSPSPPHLLSSRLLVCDVPCGLAPSCLFLSLHAVLLGTVS